MQSLAVPTGHGCPCTTFRRNRSGSGSSIRRPTPTAAVPAAAASRGGGRLGTSTTISSSSSSSSRTQLAAAPAAPQQRQVQARVRLSDLEGPTDDSAATAVAAQALQDYMQLEQSGEFNSVTVGNLRLKYGIRRGDDGRLQLRRSDGTWMQAKLDMEVAGIILLRSTADDTVSVLQAQRFKQVDLSDDYLVLMMFADPVWEDQLIPIQLSDIDGNASQLEMSEQEFKDFVGIIRSLQEASDETLAGAGDGFGDADEDDDGTIDVSAAEVTPISSRGGGGGGGRS